ncbi:MAG: nucleotide exchange factor GrpE [Desulfobacterales bacterium]|nr:nucleotide exchange factor GrpE [Desulfobacterales bacterium]
MNAKKNTKKESETVKGCADDTISNKPPDDKEQEVKTDDTIDELKAKLASKEQEAKDTYDRFLRVSADFENYKKRSERQMDDFKKFANESLIKELLPVVDNLERALITSAANEQSNQTIVEGVDLTIKNILKVFDKFSVKPMESLGKPFDPAFHQAVIHEETDDHPDNTVFKELQKGYLMYDRLLRPAMVAVSKAKTKSDGEKNE